MKLTQPQIAALWRMNSGDVMIINRAGWRQWVQEPHREDVPRAPTLDVLERRGLVKCCPIFGYRITEAGRQALKEQGETP